MLVNKHKAVKVKSEIVNSTLEVLWSNVPKGGIDTDLWASGILQ